MRYALRNTVILGVVWVLVLASGLLYGHYRNKELLRLKQKEQQLKVKLEEVSGYVTMYEGVKNLLRQVQERYQNRPRVLMAQDDPGRTFSYLNDILDVPDAFVNFDFAYVGRVDSTQYSHNTYTLSGEGDFRNLAHFLWYVEHTQAFYAVSSLEVREDAGLKAVKGGAVKGETPQETYSLDRVQFDATLRVSFSPNSHVQDTLFLREDPPDPLIFDPFRLLVVDELPPNDRGLFDVDGARLRGVGYRRAFLLDKEGKLHTLQEGDPVYLGVLSRVDPAHNRVEFLLDRGGIPEKVTLEVQLQKE